MNQIFQKKYMTSKKFRGQKVLKRKNSKIDLREKYNSNI